MYMAYFPQLKNLPPSFDVLIPFYQFEKELVKELGLSKTKTIFTNDKFTIVEAMTEKPIWAQDWWPNTVAHAFESKTQCIKLLKAIPNYGHYHSAEDSPRAKSVVRELKNLEKKRIQFNSQFKFNYFAWTAIENTLLVCQKPFSRFPAGWHEFVEDKEFPPNRAYLKLWELFTVHQLPFDKDAVAIDLGSSPGGWTWVLSQYFKKVYSVDKAPLDKKIQALENVSYFEGDAFKVTGSDFPDCTWLFSDIICTPAKSYDLIQDWMKNSNVANIICTIKFKGEADFDIIDNLLKIENSQIIHLYQNKNEVTWVKLKR